MEADKNSVASTQELLLALFPKGGNSENSPVKKSHPTLLVVEAIPETSLG